MPDLFGIPFEFVLFGVMLVGVALFHRHALAISVGGLLAVLCYQAFVSAFPTGSGGGALLAHGAHEWVTITNLFLLLLGFEVVSNQFERSNVSEHLPRLLPDGWVGGAALLGVIFVLAAFLDNIAAAVLGGVMARHLYRGRVTVGFIAAIVAASNAGGAGSVIGDTTTTIMWLHGVSPLTVIHAFVGAFAALAVIAPLAARAQHRHQPIMSEEAIGSPLELGRVWIVAVILVAAVAANVLANALTNGEEHAPWLGLALWLAILLTSLIGKPDWRVLRHGLKGAIFLCALVATASLMPLKGLPEPSWHSAFALGALSSVFDNIPLTALALRQGGYDWGLLSFAVGFGGSMVWFGSSAGVAITNLFPEARSLRAWIREAWFVPLAYLAGFTAMFLLLGWHPTPVH
jgi:Na+/H+ antiporter NhaD/arsenite permease-like protein